MTPAILLAALAIASGSPPLPYKRTCAPDEPLVAGDEQSWTAAEAQRSSEIGLVRITGVVVKGHYMTAFQGGANGVFGLHVVKVFRGKPPKRIQSFSWTALDDGQRFGFQPIKGEVYLYLSRGTGSWLRYDSLSCMPSLEPAP